MMLIKTSYQSDITSHNGVTLIELLVVITIMMSMLSLVAPLAINTVDKAQAQSEYLSFCGVLRRTSIEAFANSDEILIRLENNKLVAYKFQNVIGNFHVVSIEQMKPDIVFERTYQHLNFGSYEFKFNKNGMPNIESIVLLQQDKNKHLGLVSLLKN